MFSNAIKGVISQSDSSLRQLSKTGGLSHSTLSRWASGSSIPSQAQLERFCERARLSAEDSYRLKTSLQGLSASNIQGEAFVSLEGFPNRGEFLRALRLRSGNSQFEAARHVQVVQSTISKWEAGDSWPEPGQAERLLDLYRANEPERRVIFAPRLDWQDLQFADTAQCRTAYSQFWSTCAVHDRADAEVSSLALTLRTAQLARSDHSAMVLLGHILASRSYWYLVRHRHSDATKTVKLMLSKLPADFDYDLTSGYAFWSAGRVILMQGQLGSTQDADRMDRLGAKASHLLPRNSPYIGLLESAALCLRGELYHAIQRLRAIELCPALFEGEGQFQMLGYDYWQQTLVTYEQLFSMKARAWERVLEIDLTHGQKVPSFLSRSYALGAREKLDRSHSEAKWRDLYDHAEQSGLGFAHKTMFAHVRRLIYS